MYGFNTKSINTMEGSKGKCENSNSRSNAKALALSKKAAITDIQNEEKSNSNAEIFALSKKTAITDGQNEENIAKMKYSDLLVIAAITDGQNEEKSSNAKTLALSVMAAITNGQNEEKSSSNAKTLALFKKTAIPDRQNEEKSFSNAEIFALSKKTAITDGQNEEFIAKMKYSDLLVRQKEEVDNISSNNKSDPAMNRKCAETDHQKENLPNGTEVSNGAAETIDAIVLSKSVQKEKVQSDSSPVTISESLSAIAALEHVKSAEVPPMPEPRKSRSNGQSTSCELTSEDIESSLSTMPMKTSGESHMLADKVNMQPSFAESNPPKNNEKAIDDNNIITAEAITNSQSGNFNSTIKSDSNAWMNLRCFGSRLKLDSFDDNDDDDQGFETASVDIDSSIWRTKMTSSHQRNPSRASVSKESSKLFIKIPKYLDQSSMQSENPSAFPPPNKQSDLDDLPASAAALRQEGHSQWLTIFSPRQSTTTTEKTSSFWISSNDFTFSTEIFYNTPDQLCLLYELFSQKNADSRSLNFGIDDMKYSPSDTIAQQETSQLLPPEHGCSRYWFSTEDLAVPFYGKCMSQDKIKRLFDFVRAFSDESLRFGIDDFEFSKLHDPANNCQRFSMEWDDSMLIGLNDKSNGLEGRSMYAWPRTIQTSGSMDNLQWEINDENEEFNTTSEELKGGLTFSSFGSKLFELSLVGNEELRMPGNGNAISISQDFFNGKYENEPLDKLFED